MLSNSSSHLSEVARTFQVLATTCVAELVATPASHVRATLISLDDKLTSCTLLGANRAGPVFQLDVLRQLVVVDAVHLGFKFSLCLCFLNLLTRLLHMVFDLTLETVRDTATGTEVIRLIFFLLEEKIFAILSKALYHVGVLVADFFPLEFPASLHLIRGQEFSKVR